MRSVVNLAQRFASPAGALVGTCWVLVVVLVTMSAAGDDRSETVNDEVVVHVQLWKFTVGGGLRIRLDGKKVFEEQNLQQLPARTSDSDPAPQSVARIVVPQGSRHELRVEATLDGFQTQLTWRVESQEQWIVVSYSHRTDPPQEPPIVSFAIQDSPAKGK